MIRSVVPRYDEEVIEKTAELLSISREDYLTYLSIYSDRINYNRKPTGNPEHSWEDFCEDSEEEVAVFHRVREIISQNDLGAVVARSLKEVEYARIDGKVKRMGEREFC